MRAFLLILFLMLAAPAFATDDATLTAWDACVGSNTADYAKMFGAVSIDMKDINHALEDCSDQEEAFTKAHPELSADAVAKQRSDIAVKWLAAYKNKKGK